MKCQLFWSVDRPRSCATGDHALVCMLRKLTVSYGPTEMLYIGASPGGLPAGEASPSRHADCGTGTTGRRRPPPVESVLTGGPDRPRPGSIYTEPWARLGWWSECTLVSMYTHWLSTTVGLGIMHRGEIHIFPEIAERDRTPPVSTSKRMNLFQK